MDSPLYLEHSALLKEAGVTTQPFGELEKTLTKDDVLVIIDVQNDFFPEGTVEDGGRFGVADGEKIVPQVNSLIKLFAETGCDIYTSKDAHSPKHCSFTTNGGGFPSHCVRGSKGAQFHKDIAAVLTEVKEKGTKVIVGYKGINDGYECFSAFPYLDATGKERFGNEFAENEWYNCYVIKRVDDGDVDSEPDFSKLEEKTSLLSLLKKQIENPKSRFFVCGLAFDFCVIDSAINLYENTKKDVFIIHQATRASHIPGVGAFGSGFLTDPKELANKMIEHHLTLLDL